MLPKENRLRKAKEFQRAGARNNRFVQEGLVLKRGAARPGPLKVGIVVSKKTAKKAVERNRIRRLLREAIRHDIAELKSGSDVVLIVLPGFGAENFLEVQEKVRRIFKKALLFQ